LGEWDREIIDTEEKRKGMQHAMERLLWLRNSGFGAKNIVNPRRTCWKEGVGSSDACPRKKKALFWAPKDV